MTNVIRLVFKKSARYTPIYIYYLRLSKRIIFTQVGALTLFSQNSGNFGYKPDGTDHFGWGLPEYLGPPLKVTTLTGPLI